MSRYIDAEKLKCSIDSETDSIFDWDMTIGATASGELPPDPRPNG